MNTYSIVSVYLYNFLLMQLLLAYFFCIVPYGDSMCQDIECRNFLLLIIRGKTSYYGASKSIAVYFSAVLTMDLGTGLYLFILKIRYPEAPWISEGYMWGGMFDAFILKQKYVTHIFL